MVLSQTYDNLLLLCRLHAYYSRATVSCCFDISTTASISYVLVSVLVSAGELDVFEKSGFGNLPDSVWFDQFV